MTHATPRPRPPGPTTRAERYAALCEEFINATPERREAIGEEIEGLMARRVVPMPGGNGFRWRERGENG